MEEILKLKKAVVTSVALAFLAQMSLANASFFSDTGSAVTLTILHNNDGESALLPDQSYKTSQGTLMFGGAAGFSTVMKREAKAAKAANNALLSVYAGDSFLASKLLICSEPANPKSTATIG